MGGAVRAVFGDGESSSNTTVTTAPPTPEETELIKLNTQLAQKQLENINDLQPSSRRCWTVDERARHAACDKALNAAVTPEQQAAAREAGLRPGPKMGPIQDELLQRKLDDLRRGGAATRSRSSASGGDGRWVRSRLGDIDAPRSAASGLFQMSSRTPAGCGFRIPRSARRRRSRPGRPRIRRARSQEPARWSGFGGAELPARGQGLMSGMNLSQQNLTQRRRIPSANLGSSAFQNRLALSGQTSASGIGLAGVGNGAGVGAQSALAGTRGRNVSGTGFDPSEVISSYGKLAAGIGAALKGDE
jgi:hypothetical protein